MNGKAYTFATSSAGRSEKGKGKRDAGFIGGGAAIGAAAGAGAGTAGAAATGKKDIEYPAETRLSFATRTDVEIK